MYQRRNPYNEPTVPVIDRYGTPLGPARPSRVRRWLESGRAQKVWIKGIFAVQLNDLDASQAVVPPTAFNYKPSLTAGAAITAEPIDGKERRVIGAYEHAHRNRDISKRLRDRRDQRRARRYRLRYRPARFSNRANARTEGRLPPSIKSIVDDAVALLDTMRQLYPISHIRVEYLKFDTQLLQNPNIKGLEYQHGTLFGWQLRHYILHRDAWQCRYCDKHGTEKNPLELDHVVPKAKSGPSVVGNLLTACHRCNQKKGNRDVEDFLANDPARLDDVRFQLQQIVPLTVAGQLNSVMPAILQALEDTGLPAVTSDGATTSYTRRQLGMLKSPVNDAACIDQPDSVVDLTTYTTVLKRQSRHRRQSINCDESGSPTGTKFPAYSRLPRARQGYTTPPAHSVGPRRLRGIASGDLVRIQHHSGRCYTGRATLGLTDGSIKIKGGSAEGKQSAHQPTGAPCWPGVSAGPSLGPAQGFNSKQGFTITHADQSIICHHKQHDDARREIPKRQGTGLLTGQQQPIPVRNDGNEGHRLRRSHQRIGALTRDGTADALHQFIKRPTNVHDP